MKPASVVEGESSAFPEHRWAEMGLTKREYIAAHALQGMLASITRDHPVNMEAVAENAVSIADMLLRALHPAGEAPDGK